jgi:hypothetical protein
MVVQALYDAVVDISIGICAKGFRDREDADRLCQDVSSFADSVFDDIQSLRYILPPTTLTPYPSRSPSPADTSKLRELASRLSKHTLALQKKLDRVQNREDWSRMAPKPPMKPAPTDKDSLRVSTKTVSWSPNTSPSGRSGPPSPFQPTVEDVPDLGEDEDLHVQQFHMEPPGFGGKLVVPEDEQPPVPPTPPQLLVQRPTDPEGLHPDARPTNVEASHYQPQRPSRPTSSGTNTSSNPPHVTDQPPQDMTSSQHSVISLESIKAEIRRLEEQVRKLTPPVGDAAPRKHTRSSQSVDLGPQPDSTSSNLLLPTGTGRTRAYTAGTSDAERLQESQKDGNLPRPPMVSPYHSPHTAAMNEASSSSYATVSRPPFESSSKPLPNSRRRENEKRRREKEQIYGTAPGKSLPQGLEYGHRDDGLGITSEHDSRRTSWAYPAESPRPVYQDSGYYGGGDFELFGGSAAGTNVMSPPTKTDEAPPGVSLKKLPVTLEDLCNGANKRVKFRRRVPDSRGLRLVDEDKIMDIPIYRGLKPGSKVKFRGEGDYQEWTGTRGDVWFLLVEKEHDSFERRDHDLYLTIDVPLVEALCGWQRTVTSICRRNVKVSHEGPTAPGWQEVYPGLGMPKYKYGVDENLLDRGDLIVQTRLVWPGRLQDWQREMLRKALGGGSPFAR